eukprot:5471956-Lingulodinium_polyedra.AAC.1
MSSGVFVCVLQRLSGARLMRVRTPCARYFCGARARAFGVFARVQSAVAKRRSAYVYAFVCVCVVCGRLVAVFHKANAQLQPR